MDRGTGEAERDRHAHREAQRARGSAERATTAAYSREETALRQNQRSKADIIDPANLQQAPSAELKQPPCVSPCCK